jgi:hypothetical protein
MHFQTLKKNFTRKEKQPLLFKFKQNSSTLIKPEHPYIILSKLPLEPAE